jgi:hypothetical protein
MYIGEVRGGGFFDGCHESSDARTRLQKAFSFLDIQNLHMMCELRSTPGRQSLQHALGIQKFLTGSVTKASRLQMLKLVHPYLRLRASCLVLSKVPVSSYLS